MSTEKDIKDKRINLKVTQSEKEMFEKMSKLNGLSVSAYIMMLVTREYNNVQK